MGSRANLIIVENGDYEMYYCHWCGDRLSFELFWGPEYALENIRNQRKLEKSGWLDDIWAEGGALLDLDAQLLLFFAGSSVHYEVPLRRVYLDMMARVWSPWTVRWAYEGLVDMAEHVGVERSAVMSGREDVMRSFAPPQKLSWTDTVCSLRPKWGRLQIYPLVLYVEDYLLAGQDILASRKNSLKLGMLHFDKLEHDAGPTSGFHVDIPARRLSYWAARTMPDVQRRVVERWPDWEVIWHLDNYEWQLEVTGGKLRFVHESKESLQQMLVNSLLNYRVSDPVNFILTYDKIPGFENRTSTINPWALRDDPQVLSVELRKQILQSKLGDILNEIGEQ